MKNRTADNITAFLAGLALFALVFITTDANATPPNKKPPEPPKVVVEQEQGQHQGQEQTLTGTQETTATGTATSDATGGAADAAGGSSDVAISNVYMSRAFAQDFPITSGCFAGVNAGHDETTGSKSTGSFLGFTYLNKSCHLQGLAAQERDVMIVARLKCGDAKYRNAVAFDAKRKNRRERCIAVSTQSMIGAIEDERRRVELLEQKLQSANNRADAKAHEIELYKETLEAVRDSKNAMELDYAVCKESKERCEEKAYGGK